MEGMTLDNDDPFRSLMAWDADQPQLKKDHENDDKSSDANNNMVIVEDASTDDGEEIDDDDTFCINDELKRSYVVEELFPTAVPVDVGDKVEDDAKALSTSNHFNPDSTIAEDDTKLVPNSNANIDGPTIEHGENVFNVAAAENDAKAASNIDFDVDGSTIEQQEFVVDAPAGPAVTPTETKALDDNIDNNIDNGDEKGDDLLLSFFGDDEAVVSNHQTSHLQINQWQQEQSPQQHQQDILVQDSVLDTPLSTGDCSYPYHGFQAPVVESVVDTNIRGVDGNTDHLRNATDVTITTATITTAESTTANQNMAEDSWATQIPSAYAVSIEGHRSAHGSKELGATRHLEVNYAMDTKLTSASTANNNPLDDKRNYLDGHKISGKKKKIKKRDQRYGHVKHSNVNDFDDEEQAIHPGMVAYTQLDNQEDDNGRIHSKKSRTKTPNKQRRCIAMLCIVVVVLLAAIVGLLYYLIAFPSHKVTAENNDNGKVDLDNDSGEGGNLNSSDIQNNIEGEVNGGHLPSKAPTSNHDFNVGGTGSANGTLVDNNEHDLQHDNSNDNGDQTLSSTEVTPDDSSIVSNNATDSLLLLNSSSLSTTNASGEDVTHFGNTSFTGTELSFTTLHGEALVSGISKSYGIVFDVESLVDSLTITGMDLYLDTSFASRYEVWSAHGSWRDGAEFVEIAHGTVEGTGVCHDVHLDNCAFAPIPRDEFNSVRITGGQKASFWVTLRDDDLVSHNDQEQNGLDCEDEDALYASNEEMNVFYGTSILTYPIQLADPETDYRCGRGFIGKIRYNVGSSDNLTEPADFDEPTKVPVVLASELPSAQPSNPRVDASEIASMQPSISPTNATSPDPVDSCHFMTEEACREAASSLGLHIGGAGFPFVGPYTRPGCHFYPCSNCLFGGIAYFGSKGTVSDFQSTHSVNSEKRLDCNTNLFSISDHTPFWCLFPTTKCAGC